MNDRAVAELTSAMRHNTATLAHLARVEAATLKQFWSHDELCARYALELAPLRALLTAHQVPMLPHGRSGFRVHVDAILRLDDELRREFEQHARPA